MSRYFPHTFNVSDSEVRYSLLLYYVLLLRVERSELTAQYPARVYVSLQYFPNEAQYTLRGS